MSWPANVDGRLLQAERDLHRAERRTEAAETREAKTQAQARTEARRLEDELAFERSRSAQLLSALEQVYASTSWRVSRPVRVASKLIARLQQRPLPPSPVVLRREEPVRKPDPLLPPREAALLRRLRRLPE